MAEVLGVDISEHNGVFPFAEVKKNQGLGFAIIRASWGHYSLDKCVKQNVANANATDTPYGLYHYSYARNDNEAKLEAESFLAFSKTCHNRRYPLCLDMEDADGWKANNGVSMEQEIRTIRIWKDIVEGSGHYLMLYCNHDWYNRLRAIDAPLIDSLDQWHAHWSAGGADIEVGIWQYTSDGHLDGHSGRLDLNIAYRDYPALIGAGASTEAPAPSNPLDAYTNQQLADKVMNGDFGNGKDRENSLGSRYDAVQAIVNGAYQTPSIEAGGRCTVMSGSQDASGVEYDNWVYDSTFYVYRIIGDYVQFSTEMSVATVIGKTHITNIKAV